MVRTSVVIRCRLMAVLLPLAWVASCADDQPPLLAESVVQSRPDLVEATPPDPGRLVIVGDEGFEAVHELPGASLPRIAAGRGGRVALIAGDSLRLVPAPDSGGARGEMARAVLVHDPPGRFLLQGASSGAVIAHDPETLEPVWAWGAIDATTTALALPPWGDRLYQAVQPDEGDARLLVRDVQTGRVLGSIGLEAVTVALAVDARGKLYAVQRDGRDLQVMSLALVGDEADVLWRQRIDGESDSGAPLSLVVAGGRMVLWGEGVRWGLVTLDPANGAVTGRARQSPLDAAVDPSGNIWALYPGELRRLGPISVPRRRRTDCGGASRRPGRAAC